MKKISARLLPLLGAAALLSQMRCQGPPPETEILVRVTAIVPVDELVFRARNLVGETDELVVSVADRDLESDPYLLIVRPSNIAREGAEGFFFYVQGRTGGAVVAARGQILHFEAQTRLAVDYSLEEALASCDVDVDGFPDCRCNELEPDQQAICDCADQNSGINVFVQENCSDLIDNNCSGFPANEGCGCNESSPPLPCTTLREDQLQLAGIGACVLGTLDCIDGQYSFLCEGAGEPSSEVDDNLIDDDCDGAVDEGSSCGSGSRPCFMGLVDQAALDAAVGVCQAGTQACTSGEWSNVCLNEVRPERGEDGVSTFERDDQCDGFDNDCNGVIDDSAFFDQDADGFTSCGTCRNGVPVGGAPFLCEQDVDCSEDSRTVCIEEIGPDLWSECRCDNSAAPVSDCSCADATDLLGRGCVAVPLGDRINPTTPELCSTSWDDDCRCDHNNPVSPGTILIGEPSVMLGGGSRCGSPLSSLDCNVQERSGDNPFGNCHDVTDALGPLAPYYFGFNAGTGDCLRCNVNYGRQCNDDTGACDTRLEVCEPGCATADGAPDASELSPFCCSGQVGTCTGTVPPAWDCPLYAAGLDPFNDCASIACDTQQLGVGPFYDDVADMTADGQDNPLCYMKAAALGFCDNGLCANHTLECLDPARGAAARGAIASGADARPTCRRPDDTDAVSCKDEQPPSYPNSHVVAVFEDPYNECPGTCNGKTTGTGCLAQLGEPCGGDSTNCEDDPNVVGQQHLACVDGVCCESACSGECETCNNSGAPGQCEFVANGQTDPVTCTETNDCGAGASACQCNGQGDCRKVQGDDCSVGTECLTGFCVDGRCCENACTGTCRACNEALSVGVDGVCALTNAGSEDLAATIACTDAGSGCTGTDCVCSAAGTCLEDLGEDCSGAGECASGFCADSQCCDTLCNGNCDTCNDSGACQLNDTLCTGGCGVCGALGNCQANQADCAAQCQNCTGGGTVFSCTIVTNAAGPGCNTGGQYCCAGSCTSATGGFGAGCPSDDPTEECSGGTNICHPITNVAACSTRTLACSYCSGDLRVQGTCNDNGQCNGGTGTNCQVCSTCTDDDITDTASCVSVPSGTDTTGTNQCLNPDAAGASGTCGTNACRCDGTNSCLGALGSSCGVDDSLCESGFCRDGVCCSTDCSGLCQSCSLTPGTCTNNDSLCGDCEICVGGTACNPSATTDGDTCGGAGTYCCGGACATEIVGTFGASCATDDTSGNSECRNATNACSGTTAVCSTFGANCAYCNNDELFLGTCNAQGQCPSSATCAACQACGSTGTAGSCTNQAAGDDIITPNTCNDGTDCTPSDCTCNSSGGCLGPNASSGCTANNECISGNCATSGHCCSGAADSCDGVCQTCSTGTCATIAAHTSAVGTGCGAYKCNGVATTVCPATCDEAGTPDCETGFTCVLPGGTCLKVDGAACAADGECASNRCRAEADTTNMYCAAASSCVDSAGADQRANNYEICVDADTFKSCNGGTGNWSGPQNCPGSNLCDEVLGADACP